MAPKRTIVESEWGIGAHWTKKDWKKFFGMFTDLSLGGWANSWYPKYSVGAWMEWDYKWSMDEWVDYAMGNHVPAYAKQVKLSSDGDGAGPSSAAGAA